MGDTTKTCGFSTTAYAGDALPFAFGCAFGLALARAFAPALTLGTRSTPSGALGSPGLGTSCPSRCSRGLALGFAFAFAPAARFGPALGRGPTGTA